MAKIVRDAQGRPLPPADRPPEVEGLMAMSDTKICSGPCRSELPLSAMHFDRDNAAADGFKDICKVCRSEQRREKENVSIARRVKKLDRATAKVLDIAAQGHGSRIPHVAELFEAMIAAYGGVQTLAQHFVANHLAAKPGGSIRQKGLETVIRLAIKTSETGAARKPLEVLSDEELNALVDEQAKRMMIYQPPEELADGKKVS